MSRSHLLGLAWIVMALSCTNHATGASPKVGERHADFTLADITTGKPVKLSDFREKKLLLVHFASW